MDLKKLASKKRMTISEKEWLLSRANVLGLEYNVKGGCSECYNDLAVLIYSAENAEKQPETDIFPPLKKGVDIIFMGIRVNSATITQKITDKMIEVGLKKFFKCD